MARERGGEAPLSPEAERALEQEIDEEYKEREGEGGGSWEPTLEDELRALSGCKLRVYRAGALGGGSL